MTFDVLVEEARCSLSSPFDDAQLADRWCRFNPRRPAVTADEVAEMRAAWERRMNAAPSSTIGRWKFKI